MNLLRNFLKKLYDCKILIAILTAGLSLLLMLCVNGFSVIYSTNDDFIMSVLIENGDDRNIFMNYFLTHLNAVVQQALPFVNWFSVFQLINSFIAVCAVNYVLLKKAGKWLGLCFAAVFDLLCISSVMITVHWTQTTVMMCSAGFALLFYALKLEERVWCRVIQLITAFFLTVYGSLYRIEGFEMSALFFFVMCGVYFIWDMAKSMRNRPGFFKALGAAIKKYISVVICAVLIVALAFSCVFLSDRIKNEDPAYRDYIEYNDARASVNDYRVPSYPSDTEFYNSIDIHSEEELRIALDIHSDKDFYTAERLNRIASYAKSKGMGRQSNLSAIKSFVKSELKRLTHIENRTVLMMAMGAGGLLLIALCLVLFKFRNRLKYLFPVLLVLVWVLFLKYFGIKLETLMFLPLGALMLFTVFFCNRYYFLLCSLFSAISMGLYFYQNFSRIRYRVSYTFLLSALVFLMFFFEKEAVQKRFSDPKLWFKIALSAAAVGVSVWLIPFVNHTYISSNTAHINRIETDHSLQQYIEAHDDTFYAHPYQLYPALDSSFYNAVIPSDCPKNTLIYGDWQMASAYYDNALKANGIDRLFEEMKDSDNRRLLLPLYQDKDYPSIYETYYNAHYADAGETVRLIQEEKFVLGYDNGIEAYTRTVGVYRVVTESR